jgi:type IV pilus assembly protein PilW
MRKSRGFTLVELMIAMVLGLVIVGSVMGAMLANKRSYRTNEGLSQVQESARTAYELLAHDLRQADGNGCTSSTRTANVLNAASALWWQDWFGIAGYNETEADPAVAIGTAYGERVAGTDSISVQSMDGTGLSVALHDPVAYRLDVDPATTPHDFVPGDIVLVCDFEQAALFQATAVTGATSVFHNNTGSAPGNCSRGLGFPTSCASATGNPYTFPQNAQMARLVAVDWYIGNNDRPGEGGRSLFRRRLQVVGGAVVTTPEEIVAGITDMQMRFRATDSDVIFDDASAVTDWSVISSVLIQITALSSDANVTTAPAANTGRVLRRFNYLISLRNRLP